jgi:creatinine amidohydrolase
MATSALLTGTMAEMTATAVRAAARRGAVVLLPVGVIECLGPHLPIGTDAFIALELCRLTSRYLAGQGREAVIAPPYYWGSTAFFRIFRAAFAFAPRPRPRF